MRILITGGAGFIGSHIVDHVLNEGNEVLVVDNMSTGKFSNLPHQVSLEEMDICDSKLSSITGRFKPHLITHCAAQTSVYTSMSNPGLDAKINILGGINVARAAATSGCFQLIYVNTGGALYGNPQKLPCEENSIIQPLSAYGLSKWTLEGYFKILLPKSIHLKVLRLANIYGPRQDPDGEAGVVAIFAQRMLRGDPIVIFGDGEQTRDFLYVEDVATAHRLAQKVSLSFTANIGSETSTSINKLFRMIANETDYNSKPIAKEERPGEVKNIALANSAARRLIGWSPQYALEEGLRKTVPWIKSRLNVKDI